MTNKEIMDIAMQQSAYDTNAKVSDFLQDTNVFVKSGVGPLARKYYKEPRLTARVRREPIKFWPMRRSAWIRIRDIRCLTLTVRWCMSRRRRSLR